MALALFSSIITLTQTPIAILSLIPLLAVGINYYRYSTLDPESNPIDAPLVITLVLD